MATKSPASPKKQGPDFAAGVPLTSLQDNVPQQGFVGDIDVVVAKRGAKIFALGALCSHYGAPLHKGIVTDRGIHCPWHHACFRLADGSVERAPALDGIGSFTTHINDGMVTVRPHGAAHTPSLKKAQAPPSITLLGLGAAGMGAASELRALGYEGPIQAFEAEAEAPYDRIKLSKGFLKGAVSDKNMPLLSAAIRNRGIIAHKGHCVSAIDRQNRTLRLDDGSLHPYHALLVATGATPRRLDVPGMNKPHVHLLRSLDDARALRDRAKHCGTIVIVGASFIGLEAAAALAQGQVQVSVIHPHKEAPLQPILGEVLAARIEEAHKDHGIAIHRGRKVTAIGDAAVTLDDGTTQSADLVLVAVGVAPNTQLARECGLRVDDGIVVDKSLRTQDPIIFAAGDVAAYPFCATMAAHRIEHWAVAMQMGRVAAWGLLGLEARVAAAPFFWTEHHGIKVRYVGHAPKGAKATTYGQEPHGPLAVALHDNNQEVCAVATVDCDTLSLEVEAALDAGLSHKVSGLLRKALGAPLAAAQKTAK